jgi:hypothetical protein
MTFPAHSVLYAGQRFALADSAQGYLILAHGQVAPVQIFERSSRGWDQAYATFAQWEPNGQPAGPGAAGAGPAPTAVVPSGYGQGGYGQGGYGQGGYGQGYAGSGYPAPGYGPGPGAAQWGPVGAPRPASGVGVAGGVVSIVGLLLSLVPFAGIVFGLLLGPLAIILSGVGLGQSGADGYGGPRPKGMAVTGLVLGILTVVFKLIPGVNLL